MGCTASTASSSPSTTIDLHTWITPSLWQQKIIPSVLTNMCILLLLYLFLVLMMPLWAREKGFRCSVEMETVTKLSGKGVRSREKQVLDTESSHCYQALPVSTQHFLSSNPEDIIGDLIHHNRVPSKKIRDTPKLNVNTVWPVCQMWHSWWWRAS